MQRIFEISPPFLVPDGTLVSPFLNPKDSESDLPFDLIDGFSIAAGTIGPSLRSKICLMPFITQVTFVRIGALTVIVKGHDDVVSHELGPLTAGRAVLTRPGEFIQLINKGADPCETLYIVSPAYIFEKQLDGDVTYDDAVALDEDWDALRAANWRTAHPLPTEEQRQQAIGRLANRKRTRLTSEPAIR